MLITVAEQAAGKFWAFDISDLLMLAVVLFAPLVAVHIQRKLDRGAEKRREKLNLFATLMSTRSPNARTSEGHVEALNLIDIVFGGSAASKADRKVKDAWRVYLDALDYGGTDENERAARIVSSDEKFIDLLFAMGKAVGYEFDKPHLAKGIYSPLAHGHATRRAAFMQERLEAVLSGKQPIVIAPVAPETEPDPTQQPE